jgi:uroporphyrin-3 C-methyltransferase
VTETSTPPKPRRRWVALALGIAVIGGIAFYGWKQWYSLQQEVALMDRSLSAMVREQDLKEQATQTQIDRLVNELAQLRIVDRGDWLLAEAEYLLRLANQHAILGQDAPAAAALLTQADKVLAELIQPSESRLLASIKKVTAIRQQIAEERDALILRSDIDREGLYLQIEALIKQLEKIPVIDLENMSDQAASQIADEENLLAPTSIGERFFRSLRQALEKIGGYVRIQRHDEALKTLLSPGEQLYLKQNLRFMLEQAQIAVLQRQQPVYENSLSKAKGWITEYYVIDPVLKKKILAELADISRHNVEEPLPDISGSLVSLKALIKVRQQLGEGN